MELRCLHSRAQTAECQPNDGHQYDRDSDLFQIGILFYLS